MKIMSQCTIWIILVFLTSSAYSEQPAAFEKSQSLWKNLRQNSQLVYQFTTEYESWIGLGETTSMSVADDTVLGRSFTRWIWYYDYENNNQYTRKTIDFWNEGPTQIGQHDQGESPKTLEVVYGQCQEQILSLDPMEYLIEFEVDREGLIARCRARSIYCADDCWEGIDILELKILSRTELAK